ncbi:MAG: hypothetical protein PHE96_01090 [Methylococcales bacterium]|nr:hypothetical protein [Methylococcales bacterium]
MNQIKRTKARAKHAATVKLAGKFRTIAVNISGFKTRPKAYNQQTFQAAKAAIKSAQRNHQAINRAAQVLAEQLAALKDKEHRALGRAVRQTCGRYDGELARDESGQIIGIYRRSGYQVAFHPIK